MDEGIADGLITSRHGASRGLLVLLPDQRALHGIREYERRGPVLVL